MRNLLLCALVLGSAPEAVREAWEGIPHLHAVFAQQTYWSFLDQTKTVRGRLWYQSPDRFRVTLSPPDSQIIVSDGESLWVWTPEVGRALHAEAPGGRDPISWVVGAHDLAGAAADSSGLPGYVLELPESSPWTWAAVWVDSVTLLPVRLRLRDRTNRAVTYRFLEYDRSVSPPESLFERPP